MSDNILEKQLCGLADFPSHSDTNQIIGQYNALSTHNKERLIGYLDALSQESDTE